MDFSRKIWHDIFQLSQAVFRVTHLFPQNEILKRHLRGKITEILYQSSPNFGSKNYKNLVQEFHGFRALLFSAKSCNFVNEKNLIILINECEKMIENLDPKTGIKISEIPVDFASEKTESYNPEIGEKNTNLLEGKTEIFGSNFTPKIHEKIVPAMSRKAIKDISEDSSMIGFFMPNSRQQKIVDFFSKTPGEKLGLRDVATSFREIPPRTIRHDLKDLCDQGFLGRSGHGPSSVYFLIKK